MNSDPAMRLTNVNRRRFIGAVATASVVSIAGCSGDSDSDDSEDESEETDTPESTEPVDPETKVRCWIDENRDRINTGQDELRETAGAFDDGDYAQVMYHSRLARDEYDFLNTSAEELSVEDAELETALENYFYHALQASSAAYSAGFEVEENDDPAAADAMIERLSRHSNDAADARSALKSQLGVDESTELSEINVDSERC
jgi:hypothetical protein